jgi:hypothetical protein
VNLSLIEFRFKFTLLGINTGLVFDGSFIVVMLLVNLVNRNIEDVYLIVDLVVNLLLLLGDMLLVGTHLSGLEFT